MLRLIETDQLSFSGIICNGLLFHRAMDNSSTSFSVKKEDVLGVSFRIDMEMERRVDIWIHYSDFTVKCDVPESTVTNLQ